MFQNLILYVFEPKNKTETEYHYIDFKYTRSFFFSSFKKKKKQNTGVSFSSFYPILVLNEHFRVFFSHCIEKKKRKLTINYNNSSLNKKNYGLRINLKLVSITDKRSKCKLFFLLIEADKFIP